MITKREAELRAKRDKSHVEQIERWANFVKNNPGKWKKEHTAFINAQINKANEFYNNLNDKEFVKKLRNIKD